MNQKLAEDEVAAARAATHERLQRDLVDLQRELEARDAREEEAETQRRKLEYLKQEAEVECEDLRRKLVGCENDVGRLKVRTVRTGRCDCKIGSHGIGVLVNVYATSNDRIAQGLPCKCV